MTREHLLSCILNAFPYPIVFVDKEYVIRYMNREAVFRYEKCRGLENLIGTSVLERVANEKEQKEIKEATKQFEHGGTEVYAGVTDRNMRKYYVPVRDKEGCYIGYYERLEFNREL